MYGTSQQRIRYLVEFKMASDMEKEKDDDEEKVHEESEELDSDSEEKEEETNDGEKKQYTFTKGFDIMVLLLN